MTHPLIKEKAKQLLNGIEYDNLVRDPETYNAALILLELNLVEFTQKLLENQTQFIQEDIYE